MKYEIQRTSAFKKDYKKALKQGRSKALLREVVLLLADGKPLPVEKRDHALSGEWSGYRECHIAPDWLLIYRILDDKLILSLTRTGSHSYLELD